MAIDGPISVRRAVAAVNAGGVSDAQSAMAHIRTQTLERARTEPKSATLGIQYDRTHRRVTTTHLANTRTPSERRARVRLSKYFELTAHETIDAPFGFNFARVNFAISYQCRLSFSDSSCWIFDVIERE